MLVELTSVANIPNAHGVVETAREDAHAVGRDVDATGAVRVALELFEQNLIVYIPDGYVAVRTTRKADLGVW